MRKIKLIRKNIKASTTEHFEFDVNGFEYLVKNFNDFDIYVSFESTNDTSKMIKIPAETSQICVINKSKAYDFYSQDVYVYADTAGEVEIQCIKY